MNPPASRRLSAWLAAALAACIGCDAPPSRAIGMLRGGIDSASGGVLVEVDLTRGLSEQAPQIGFLAGAASPSIAELTQVLNRASTDRRTRGLFVRLGEGELSWAQAEELGRRLSTFDADKPVACHAHGYSNTSLLFALRACDRIWLSPAGEVASVGIAGQMLYLKRLLDRLNVQADFLHMGKYKSAAETFTEDGPTEPARESLEAVLGSIRQTWLDGLRGSRLGERMQSAGTEVQAAAEHGPWSPEAALAQGLIDAVGYASEARDDAKKRASVDEVETSFGMRERRDAAEEISQLIRFLSGAPESENGGDHIVVLPAAGGISMSAGGPFGDGGIAAEPLSRTLRRLRDNDSVKAVVLRIDSPGGSALASDLLWHELMLLRQKKPLIASLAGTAASGGYYMACAANRILAERTTILGSIGVVGGKIVFGNALDQIGVSHVTLPASNEPGAAARAAYLSPLTPWDDATRDSVRAQMRAIYELFLRRVSEGRGLPLEDVRNVAEGRIWTGTQGLEHRLIDAYGGLTEAVALAQEQAGVPATIPVRIEGGPETLLEFLQLEADADDAAIRAALARLRAAAPTPLRSVAEPLRPYAESLAPLLGRERVVTAVPFALDVR